MFVANIGKTDEEKYLSFMEIRETHKSIIKLLVKYCGIIFSLCALAGTKSILMGLAFIPLIYLVLFVIALGPGYCFAWYIFMLADLSKNEDITTSNQHQLNTQELVESYLIGGREFVATQIAINMSFDLPFIIGMFVLLYTAPINAILRLPQYIMIPKRLKEKYTNQ